MERLLLTFDTDWAPDFVIQDTLDLLGDIPAIFFITDEISASILNGMRTIETGIHPNFMPGSSHGTTRRQVLETVLRLVPEAKIVRAHNLCQDTTILDLYVEYGIQTDMSILQYQNPCPKPFHHWNNLLRVPYNFEDDIACMRDDIMGQSAWLDTMPILICDFHPIHIYLNTDTMERYARLRQRGNLLSMKPSDIDPFVNRAAFGVRTVLTSLRDKLRQGNFSVDTLAELMNNIGVEGWADFTQKKLSTQQ